jgi:transcriptional regulator with XRE-family HTH domain
LRDNDSLQQGLTKVKMADSLAIMTRQPKTAVPKGPTSERVAHNVRQLRSELGLSLEGLSRRLGELGRPIRDTGLSKLEAGERRVDVDDLMALAMALEVTPNRLLLDSEADDEPIALTETYQTNRRQAWAWSCGEWADGTSWPFLRFTVNPRKGAPAASFRFRTATRPHDPPVTLTPEEWRQVGTWQRRLDKIAADMRDKEVPASLIRELVRSGITYVGDDKEGSP